MSGVYYFAHLQDHTYLALKLILLENLNPFHLVNLITGLVLLLLIEVKWKCVIKSNATYYMCPDKRQSLTLRLKVFGYLSSILYTRI